MPHRRAAVVLSIVFMLLAGQAEAAPPVIKSAVSRMTQGGKAYDIALPLAGPSGIECRSAANGLTVVVRFNQSVNTGKVTVASGKAALKGSPKFSSQTMTVQLTGVGDAQEITLALNKVGTAASGLTTTLKLRVLTGDVSGDGVVNDVDVQTAAKKLGTVNVTNFRADINASGSIKASDVNVIKANIGHSIGGGTSNNAPPVINPISDQKLVSGLTPPGIGVAVKDTDTPLGSVVVVASTDNPNLVPAENVTVSGEGASRVLTINANAGKSGTANVTVTASDGLASSTQTFQVNFAAPPSLFTANLRPATTGSLLGFAQATLMLSSDETQAIVRVTYSNLTGPKTAIQIHGPAAPGATAPAIVNLDTITPNQDGSLTWVLAPAAGLTVAQIVDAIKQGQTYIDISTATNASEIRGQLVLNANVTFTPPGAPPSIPSGPPTQNDASRFLTQATFGPSAQDIALVQAIGFDAWLQQQFDLPPSYTSTSLKVRQALGEDLTDESFIDEFVESWWSAAITAPDQLRHRVAFALSEIFVVSQDDPDLNRRPLACADYYDMLVTNAFGNYRQLLEEVTLHPAMGNYLDMRGNRAQYTNAANQIVIPNENYAREILQLFSIGLNELHPDGTLKLDDLGQPIPTYDQPAIQGFARVFTGWNYHQAGTSTNPTRDDYQPMTLVASWHETGTKELLGTTVLPANQGGIKDLADAHNLIYKHPNTGPFICKQLIQRLVTDNPSPGYVYRVSKVFADNGQGIRGDLKAVVKAILLDYEARSTAVVSRPGYGKVREPVLRVSHAVRALHPVSTSGYFKITSTETQLQQTPLRAPTVFNFFLPDFVFTDNSPSKPNTVSKAGLVVPEMQVHYETSAINYANFMEVNSRATIANGNDVKYDLSTEQAMITNVNDCSALVDKLNTVLMQGNMSTGMRTTLLNYVNGTTNFTASDTLGRARALVHLITTSPEYCTQR